MSKSQEAVTISIRAKAGQRDLIDQALTVLVAAVPISPVGAE